MRRIPMTAQAQLSAAREMGHELSIEQGASRPDYAGKDADGERYRLVCTCGWKSNWRGSRRALNSRMGLHLGEIIADYLDSKPSTGDVVPLRGGPGDSTEPTTVTEVEYRAK